MRCTPANVVLDCQHQREEVVHHMSEQMNGTLEVVGR